jgi:hypothetical protein
MPGDMSAPGTGGETPTLHTPAKPNGDGR